MAANLFGRYVWLVDIIRQHKRLTYEEINRLWKESGLSYGDEDSLPLRTFHNHRKAIMDIFNIDIECDKNGYKYYIDDLESLEHDTLRSWLIDSYTTLNQIQADGKLENRIIFENIPSGRTWLTAINNAMRKNEVLYITYQSFWHSEPNSFEIEPYYLKIVKQRWYVIARSPYYSARNKAEGIEPADVYRIYALDRIKEIVESGKTFEFNKNFDIEHYFEGCCGVIPSEEPAERVVIAAYGEFANYLRTLPLHKSQKETGKKGDATLFEYRIKPTFDFYQLLLAQGNQLEVLEPESIRNEMRNRLRQTMARYENKTE